MASEKNADKNNDKNTALEAALKQIEKSFGKGSVMKLGASSAQGVDVIPTGCLPLDIALGVGGIPRGRIIEIYGPESSGKTTLALHIAAEAQKMGGIAAFMRSMLLTRFMRIIWVLIWTSCWFLSQIVVSRPLKLPKRWCAVGRLMWLSWIRWLLWFRVRNWRAIWAMRMLVCRPD